MKNKEAGGELVVQLLFWWENIHTGVSTDTREYMDCSSKLQKKRTGDLHKCHGFRIRQQGVMRNVDLSKALPSKNIFKHFSV